MMSKIYFFSSSKVCRTLNQNDYNNVSCGITLLYCCLSTVLLPVLLALYVYSYYHLCSNRLGVSMVSCCMFVICVMFYVVQFMTTVMFTYISLVAIKDFKILTFEWFLPEMFTYQPNLQQPPAIGHSNHISYLNKSGLRSISSSSSSSY